MYKDFITLSPVLLDILRSYIKNYDPKPKKYLFESEQTLTAYPTRTVQQTFGTAKAKAGIGKEVGMLGHFDIKTTERYLHISKKQLVNIVSPFDDLWKNNKIE